MDGGDRPVMRIPATLDEARAVQEAVAREAAGTSPVSMDRVQSVGGADASYSRDGRTVHAAAVVMGLPCLDILEQSTFACEASFPYLPGYFAFREGPAIIGAVTALEKKPGLLIMKGHGLAHPRRAGIAVHVGLVLGTPTAGVAEHLLCGDASMPGPARGSSTPVMDRGELVGVALRTLPGSRPLFVSPGFATDLETAVAAVLSTTARFRIPAPLREAHRVSREARARGTAGPASS